MKYSVEYKIKNIKIAENVFMKLSKKITAKNDVNPEIKVRIVPVREFINNGFILIFFLKNLYNSECK